MQGLYDQESYKAASVLFTSKSLQNEWTLHCTAYLTPTPVPCVEDEGEFNQSLKSIQSKNFDSELQTLKILYHNCPDKKSYYTLVDELTFGSDKDDLTNFIKKRGKITIL